MEDFSYSMPKSPIISQYSSLLSPPLLPPLVYFSYLPLREWAVAIVQHFLPRLIPIDELFRQIAPERFRLLERLTVRLHVQWAQHLRLAGGAYGHLRDTSTTTIRRDGLIHCYYYYVGVAYSAHSGVFERGVSCWVSSGLWG